MTAVQPVELDDLDLQIKALKQRLSKAKALMSLKQQVSRVERGLLDNSEDNLSIDKISEEVCVNYGASMASLLSRGRPESIALPRQVIFYLTRKICHIPFATIGKYFSKDHGTVMHGCDLVKTRMEVDKVFEKRITELETKCRARFERLLTEGTK